MHVDLWIWIAFNAFIVLMLAVDLLVFHREAHAVRMREAAIWSGVWVSLGLLFGVVILLWQGTQPAGEYLAGYLIEKSLSVDNIFVFAVIFSFFAVPAEFQHRVLYWGVLGALIFRAIFIALGVVLLEHFHWTIYIFGAFLVFTGFRLMRPHDPAPPDRNVALRIMRRFVPMTGGWEGPHFFVKRDGKRLATPLLAVLFVVETSDIMFAVDSIPAIFAVTTDPFLVFTSNAFAILGLRALYFLLAGMIGRFVYLKFGLAAILILVGVKMLLSDILHIPIWLSLVLIVLILAITVVASLRHPPSPVPPPPPGVPPEGS